MRSNDVRFGRFHFDVGRNELVRDGSPVKVGSRALQILAALVSARGEIVTKDQLLARVWPGLTVEENNLQVQISALRRALDPVGDGHSHLITVPGRGYRLELADDRSGLSLPSKPSIAVLAFQNMSGDPQEEYFADGIVEDIITALCRVRWLFVIARNSSFAYKGRVPDVKEIGRELGVRYILEGGIRKANQHVRITAQLVDASNGAHLWGEHFDANLSDIFELQDRVTSSVVGAISPKLVQAEIERIREKPTESLDAFPARAAKRSSDDPRGDHRSTAALCQSERTRCRFRDAERRGCVLLRGQEDKRLVGPVARHFGCRSIGIACSGNWA
jgi:TolB-like protein